VTAVALPSAGALDFELPAALVATEPAEVRGAGRDDVRLLVAEGAGGLRDAAFRDLPALLDPGDLLVVNTSATLPAAVAAGERLVHLSTRLPGGLWLVELRRPAGAGSLPLPDAGEAGATVALDGGGCVRLLGAWPGQSGPARLWVASVEVPGGLHAWLERNGRPIRYGRGGHGWPLAAYQTVFATEPGSAEMPSAGRAFTPEIVTALVARGVGVTPLLLHAGVSSQEAGEPPYPEPYRVPPETAARVNATRAAGGRVIAVGTTVTRALETVAEPGGRVHPGAGWTELVVTAARGVRAVDGLLTGWHEPHASHLDLLHAVAGRELLERSYAHALAAGYRWHEFGDLHLLLP
jgi:S-adenosylmethionine:tRNA ribosyltransferase-isomerase